MDDEEGMYRLLLEIMKQGSEPLPDVQWRKQVMLQELLGSTGNKHPTCADTMGIFRK